MGKVGSGSQWGYNGGYNKVNAIYMVGYAEGGRGVALLLAAHRRIAEVGRCSEYCWERLESLAERLESQSNERDNDTSGILITTATSEP